MKKKVFFAIFISLSMFSFSQQICLTNQESELIRLINAKRQDRGLTECNFSSTLMMAANENCKENGAK